LSFPDCIQIIDYEMCWMGWEQSNKPFTPDMLKYISKIDIVEDIKNLSQNIKIKDKSLKNVRIANTVLKIGAANGLTLNQIGSMIYRSGLDENQPSLVETLVDKAEKIINLYTNLNNDILSSLNMGLNKKQKEPLTIKLIQPKVRNSMKVLPKVQLVNQRENDIIEYKPRKSEHKVIKFEGRNSFDLIDDKELEDTTDTDSIPMIASCGKRHSDDSSLVLFNKCYEVLCDYKENNKILEKMMTDQIMITKEVDDLKSTRKRKSLLKRTASEPKMEKLVPLNDKATESPRKNKKNSDKKKIRGGY